MKTTLLHSIHAFAQSQLKNRKVQTTISEPQSTHHSKWTMAVLVVFALITMIPSKALAQQEICDLTVNYSGTYQDFVLPSDVFSFSIQAKGGDGGYGKVETFIPNPIGSDFLVNDCLGDGGTGATASATFLVGNGEGQIPPNSLIRTIVGGQGQSIYEDSYVGYGQGGGGGGGGTGVLYQAPGSNDWNILLVSAGGGGGYASMFAGGCAYQENGGGGNSGTDGDDGGGINGGDGGSNGGGGYQGANCDGVNNAGGGGGAYEDGLSYANCEFDFISCGSGGAGWNGAYDGCCSYDPEFYWGGNGGGEGSEHGSIGCNYPSGFGGYGFGGGGSGGKDPSGGGGGGYSGGGGGVGSTDGYIPYDGLDNIPLNPPNGNEGGGGGSYVSSLAVVQDITSGGSNAYPTHGFVTITCGGTQFSECAPDVTLNTDLGEAFATANLAPPIVPDDCNVPGNALHFDGVDDFVDIGDISEADFGTDDFTIEFWMNTASIPQTGTPIISKRAICNCSSFWNFYLNSNGTLVFEAMESAECDNIINLTTATSVNDGAWHHIAITRDGNSVDLYRNGSLEASISPGNITNLNNEDPMRLGKSACSDIGTPLYYEGMMDELRIWSEGKTQSEIQDNMNCEFTSKAWKLEAVYNFNSGQAGANNDGTTYAFDYANDNGGELYNFTLTGPESNWVNGNPWSTIVSNAPETFPLGSTLVVWTVTDENGAISTCGQNVTVIDYEPPAISCAPDQMISTMPSQCEPQVVLSEPTVSDNGHPSSNVLHFDGQDDFVDLGNVTETNFGTGDFTIEFWMRVPPNPGNDQGLQTAIISKRSICNCSNLWNIILRDDGKVYFEALEANCANFYELGTSTPVNDNNWHHIAIRRLNAELNVYLDGFLSASITPPTITNLNNGDPLQIGRSACSDTPLGQYYSGQLDEVRIWDDARSDFEINSNMNATLGPQPNLIVMLGLDEGLVYGDNTGVNTAVDSSGNGNDGTLNNFALVGFWSNWQSRWTPGLTVTNDAPGQFPIGSTAVTWTATDLSGNTASCAQNIVVNDDHAPIISCPADMILEPDSGENFATTTIPPPAATDNCSALGNALNFDGVDDQVTITNPVDSVFTIEAWIKTSATSNTGTFAYEGNPILWSGVFGGGNDFTLSILNNKLSFFDGAGDISTDGTTILNDDTWHHIAVVRNGVLDTTILYVDGIPDGSNTCNNDELNANPNIVLGGNLIDQHYFNGSIDEVRIWSGALSEAAIQINMNSAIGAQGGLLASYQFNEGDAGGDNSDITTVSDASGNDNNGVLSGFDLTGMSSNWVDNSEMTFTNDAPATFPIGNTTVTWTAMDPSGNESSCSFTVTVLSENAALNGNVSDLIDCGEREITLAIYNPESSELGELFITTIDANGDYITPEFPIGTYDVYVTVEGYLTQLYSAVTIGNGINELDVTGIVAGDIDGSNGINISDVSLLIASFGSSQGDANFIPLGDFNCDGAINIIDISILTISFGLVGDSPPND